MKKEAILFSLLAPASISLLAMNDQRTDKYPEKLKACFERMRGIHDQHAQKRLQSQKKLEQLIKEAEEQHRDGQEKSPLVPTPPKQKEKITLSSEKTPKKTCKRQKKEKHKKPHKRIYSQLK